MVAAWRGQTSSYKHSIFFIVQVSILDVDEEKGNTTCTDLKNEHSTENVTFIVCDVSSQDQLVMIVIAILLRCAWFACRQACMSWYIYYNACDCSC